MYKNRKRFIFLRAIGLVLLVVVWLGGISYFLTKINNQDKQSNNNLVQENSDNQKSDIGENNDEQVVLKNEGQEYFINKLKKSFQATELVNSEIIRYDNLNDSSSLEDILKASEDYFSNQNNITFWSEAYCPNSGTNYDYAVPNGFKLVHCEQGETGSHGGCPTCIMSEIVLTADFLLSDLSFDTNLVEIKEHKGCEKKAKSIDYYKNNIEDLYYNESNPTNDPYEGLLFKKEESGENFQSSILDDLKKIDLSSDEELKTFFAEHSLFKYVKISRGKFDRCSENPVILVYAYENNDESKQYRRTYIYLIRKDGDEILFNYYFAGYVYKYSAYMLGGPKQISENSPYLFTIENGGFGSAAAGGEASIVLLENLRFIPIANFPTNAISKGSSIVFAAEYNFEDIDSDGKKEVIIEFKKYEGSSAREDIILQEIKKKVVLKWNEETSNFSIIQ